MKKVVLLFAVVAVATLAFFAGRAAGIHHAITQAEIITERPEEIVIIQLDGEQYEHRT